MNRRAFTLMELLVVIGVLPIFMLVSTQLYRGIMISSDTSHRQISARSTFDAATDQMWRDLFSAREVRSTGPRSVVITDINDRQIQWQGDNGNLVRVAADRRTFKAQRDLQLQISFENQNIIMELIGPQGCEDRAVCGPPFSLRRPS